jgi:hypothetical protein
MFLFSKWWLEAWGFRIVIPAKAESSLSYFSGSLVPAFAKASADLRKPGMTRKHLK